MRGICKVQLMKPLHKVEAANVDMAANVRDAGNNVSEATLNPAVTSMSTVAGGGRTYTLAQNVSMARVRKQRHVLQIL